MKIPTLLIFLLSLSLLTSQDLKTKKEYHKYFKEIYEIDKKTKVKEGTYVQLDEANGDTLSTGFYSLGTRKGLWKFYGKEGVLTHTYDYDTNSAQVFHHKNTDSIVIPILKSGGEFVLEKVDREPLYLGYSGEFKDRIIMELDFEKLVERGKEKQGMTVLSMMVDARGKLRAFRIEETHDLEVAQMLIAAVKKVPGDWSPAVREGIPENSKILLVNDLRVRMSTEPNTRTFELDEKPGVYILDTRFTGYIKHIHRKIKR